MGEEAEREILRLTTIPESIMLHRVQMDPQRGRGNMAVRRPTRTAPGSRTAAAAPAPRKGAPARRQAAAPAKPSRDVTQYADKEPTPYHKAFATWIIKEVGLSLEGKSARAAFLAGVSIATAARAAFQESDFLEEWREKTGEVKRGPKPKADEPVTVAGRTRSQRAKAAPEPEPEEEEEEWEEDDTEEDDEEFDSEDDADEDDDSEDESDDDEDWEDEEEPTPAPKRTARKSAPAKAAPTRARAGAKAPVKATKPASGRPAKAKAAPADDDDFIF